MGSLLNSIEILTYTVLHWCSTGSAVNFDHFSIVMALQGSSNSILSNQIST